MLLSIITPVFNEESNVQTLFEILKTTLSKEPLQWEWIVVDDHSQDSTFTILKSLAYQNPEIKVFRLSRNSGSHIAITCGLNKASGDCATVIAGDLQDSPEIIPKLIKCWKDGNQVVWAARHLRPGERRHSLFFGSVYYFLMRKIVGLKSIPSTGADCFLLDRIVLDSLKQFRENNVSLFALIAWMGFKQITITYDKHPRVHGKSKWTIGKKIKLVVDSVTSFSYFPIRMMSYLGFFVSLMGFFYIGLVLFNVTQGKPPQGWTSLIVVSLVTGGILMMMLGIIGEYVWRALDESRQRPQYLIEEFYFSDHTNSSI